MNLWHQRLLAIGLSLLPICTTPMRAQTLTVLHAFTNGGDGSPWTGVVPSGNRLYGTTALYGSSDSDRGTIFAINSDGTAFVTLRTFPPFAGRTNDDGVLPNGLVCSGNVLYGTTRLGGSTGWGSIFRLNTDGSGYTNLYSFSVPTIGSDTNAGPYGTNSDGAEPMAVAISDETLFGVAYFGGAATNHDLSNGTLFRINTDGSAFTNLHNFLGAADGAHPNAGLVLSGNKLCGVTQYGGSNGCGTVFSINTDGTSFTNLHSFAGGLDGANPSGTLLLLGDTLYGMTSTFPGPLPVTLFKINTDGTGFATLHAFTNLAGGACPSGGLVLSSHTLYGTTQYGGTNSFSGTAFKVNLDGTGFTVLYYFTNGLDGATPLGSVVLAGDSLYGTANGGGSAGYGTVFALNLSIPLSFQLSDLGVVLSWSDPSFFLQAAPDPAGVFTNVTGASSPYTNTYSDPQMFFRLRGQ